MKIFINIFMAKGKIKNKNKKPTAACSYYFVAHLDPEGEVTPLLLTDVEYEKAKKRAEKNPEDVPEHFITFTQQHKESDK
jgi:hypothetical protein